MTRRIAGFALILAAAVSAQRLQPPPAPAADLVELDVIAFDRDNRPVWREAGHDYLLGYCPAASTHDLRSIEVSVTRQGGRARARQRR